MPQEIIDFELISDNEMDEDTHAKLQSYKSLVVREAESKTRLSRCCAMGRRSRISLRVFAFPGH